MITYAVRSKEGLREEYPSFEKAKKSLSEVRVINNKLVPIVDILTYPRIVKLIKN